MKKFRTSTLLFASAGMLVLILDGKTAIKGIQQGLSLCCMALIPSLFPFFFLSALLTGALLGQAAPLLRPVGRLCRIPPGAEPLLAVGFLGGYPVGAQNVALACRAGQLKASDAARMLPFCSNAGPAFLFGILGPMFSDGKIPWILWAIHILSALTVGAVLPGGQNSVMGKRPETAAVSLTEALEKAVKAMALVCGWAVLFRMLLTFLDRWILWALPQPLPIAAAGLLELSNGCIQLSKLDHEGARFVLAAVLLAQGGVCVALQTASVTQGLSLKWYIPGKLLQAAVSFLLASLCQGMLPSAHRVAIPLPLLGAVGLGCVILLYFFHRQEKSSSILAPTGV